MPLHVIAVRTIKDGVITSGRERSEAVHAYKAAGKAVESDFVSKLRDGRLTATGFVVRPSGRDPGAPRRRVPDDVLSAKTIRINWRKDKITGNEMTYKDVRVFGRFELHESASSLIGCSLAECFERIVVDDWVRRELGEAVFRRHPDWAICLNTSYGHFTGQWPVRFEDWSEPADSVTASKFPISSLNKPCPDPPEDAVAVRARTDDQVRRLIRWLRDSTLLADGIKEPKDHALTRMPIPADWWTKAGVEFDETNSCLWAWEESKRILIFSDIRIVVPDAKPVTFQATDTKEESPENSSSPLPRLRIGQSQVWDYLTAWKKREPDVFKTPNKAEIARQVSKQSDFAGYKFETIETYVRRAFSDPDF